MMRPYIAIPDFIVNGYFGPFGRDATAGEITSLLGPPDPWVTHQSIYSYGNVGFEMVDDPSPSMPIRIAFNFQHPEHFTLPYESWRETAEPSWRKLLYDWPDSRFRFELGPFRSGATLDAVADYLPDAEELEPNEAGSCPVHRIFIMPCGVSVEFSNFGMNGEHTLLRLDTVYERWAPNSGSGRTRR